MATFAARDQENVVQGWEHAAAGSKTVGKGGRALAPKTPGKNAITPAAPRTNRAPLGAKTTNVKPTAFKTPALLTAGTGLQKTQRRSASGKKPKLKIHQPEAVETAPELAVDDEEPEIEFCPPKFADLPDEPDADEIFFPPNYDFSWVRKALRRPGFNDDIHNKIGEDGLSKYQREKKENREYTDAYIEASLLESIESSTQPEDRTPEFEATKKAAIDHERELDQRYFNGRFAKLDMKANTDPKKHQPPKQPPSTLSAREAVTALNSKPKPRFAAPTAATKGKQSVSSAVEADAPVKKNPPKPANLAASRSTIGYARGRKVSSTLKQNNGPNASAASRPKTGAKSAEVKPDDQKRNQLLENLMTPEEDEDDGNGLKPINLFEDEEAGGNWFEQQMSDFRLSLPEDDEDDGRGERGSS